MSPRKKTVRIGPRNPELVTPPLVRPPDMGKPKGTIRKVDLVMVESPTGYRTDVTGEEAARLIKMGWVYVSHPNTSDNEGEA